MIVIQLKFKTAKHFRMISRKYVSEIGNRLECTVMHSILEKRILEVHPDQ